MKTIFKTIYAVIMLICLGMTLSCEKWLNVRPSNQFDEDEQFTTRDGYVDVLIGSYQSLTDQATYGAEMSFRFVDVLAQLYANKASGNYYELSARYDYTAVSESQHSPRGLIGNIWSKQYNSIAQLNYLLKHMESKPGELSESDYLLIKGEALALRAFLHFDLLRLFAPAYNASQAASKAIPYMQDFTVSPGDILTSAEIIQQIETDLLTAIDLQKDFQGIDQISQNRGLTNSELFYTFRQNRMNYWAAKALLARVYLYASDHQNAKKYALEVINSGKFQFTPIATRVFDERNEESDISFTKEHIFSLYHSGLKNIADNFFKTTAADPESTDLFNTRSVLNTIYETTGTGLGTDIRSPASSPSRWNEHNNTVVYTKKYYSDHETNVNQRLIPLIRLPEMYYIAAESSSSIEEALVYINAVRTARGITSELTSTQISSSSLLQSEIFKEYRKEFYGEGQLWYFYKRLSYTTLYNTVYSGSMASVYTFPIPDTELEFNPNYN